jgi:hypothetical protein
MHTGMLWFDNSKSKTITAKIHGGVDYYRQKYGRTPDLILIHPSMMDESVSSGKIIYRPSVVKDNRDQFGPLQKDIEIVIRPYRPVLPGHIWIGIEDDSHPYSGGKK